MGCGKGLKGLLPIIGIAAAIFAPMLLPEVFGATAAGGATAGGLAAAGETAALGAGGALIDAGLSTGIASSLGAGAAATAGGAGIATGAGALLGEAGLGALGAGALSAGAGATAATAASSGLGSLLSGLTVKDGLSAVQTISQLAGGSQKQPKMADATTPQEVTAPKTQAETLYQNQRSPNNQNMQSVNDAGIGKGSTLLSKLGDEEFMKLLKTKTTLGSAGKLG